MTLDANLAAHCFHQTLADGKPETGPFMATRHRGIHLGEGSEQLAHLIGGDPATAVVHLENEHLAVLQ